MLLKLQTSSKHYQGDTSASTHAHDMMLVGSKRFFIDAYNGTIHYIRQSRHRAEHTLRRIALRLDSQTTTFLAYI
jgi:flagellar basal body rod protein FlgG